MKKVLGVYGASGFGREVKPLAYGYDSVVFIDDSVNKTQSLNNINVYNLDQFLNLDGDKSVSIAVADSKSRELLTNKVTNQGLKLANIQASNVIKMDNVKIGIGHILCPFVTLTSDIKIGKSFHANIYSYIAHDCIIGDYVTFAPSVKCNGNVVIEDHAYIGTGAIIKQGKPGEPTVIGEGAVVGMGAVVTKSVPAGDIVIGNPAKKLIKKV